MSLGKLIGIAVTMCAVSLFAGTRTWDFNEIAEGATPEGWKLMSGETSPGGSTVKHDGSLDVTWEAQKDATAPGAAAGNIVMSVTKKGTNYNYGHHCWFDGIKFTDCTIEVDLVAHGTEKGHMGLSWRIKDYKTFYATRLQAANGDVQTIDVNGGAIQYRTSNATVDSKGFEKWFKMKVVIAGSNMKVFVDGKQAVNYTDEKDPITEAGGVGLFVRGEKTTASFDNFKVTSDDIVSVGWNKKLSLLHNDKASVSEMALYDIQGRFLGVGASAFQDKTGRAVLIVTDKSQRNR